MSRIGSFQQTQILTMQMMRAQQRHFESQTQVATGHRAEYFKDLKQETPGLLGAKTVEARIASFMRDDTVIRQRLEQYDGALRGLESLAADLRESVQTALANKTGMHLPETMEAYFDSAIGILNTSVDGRYIFGGTNSSVPPVNISDIGDLIALPEPPTAAFDNNQTELQAKVDENTTLKYGQLADDAGGNLLLSMQRILMFHSGTLPAGAGAFAPAGPLGDPLTPNQADFLANELAALETTVDELTTKAAVNGEKLNQLEAVTIRLESQKIVTARFISNIEDVDLAEAASRLQQDEVAVRASMTVLSRLGDLNLLDFL